MVGTTLISLLLLGSIGYAMVVMGNPAEMVFNVEAQTERLDIEIRGVVPFQWPLHEVQLVEGSGVPLVFAKEKTFTGSIEIEPPVKVLIERVALGPLTIDIENTAGGSAGQLYENDEALRRAGRVVHITIPNLPRRAVEGRTIILTLIGEVKTGRPIGGETRATTSLLRSGTLTMLARPIFGDAMFQAARIELHAGDHFAIGPQAADEAPPSAVGFVLADERPALTALYRIVGRRAQITRAVGSQLPVEAPLVSRFIHDKVLKTIVQVIAFVAALATFVSSLLQGREAMHTGAARRT